MRTKMWKAAAVVAMAGTLLQFGGCLSGDFLGLVLANSLADQFGGFIPDLTSFLPAPA